MLPLLAGPEGVAAWTGPRGSWRPIMEAPGWPGKLGQRGAPPGPSAFTMWQGASGCDAGR
jgi:hypothetical protein